MKKIKYLLFFLCLVPTQIFAWTGISQTGNNVTITSISSGFSTPCLYNGCRNPNEGWVDVWDNSTYGTNWCGAYYYNNTHTSDVVFDLAHINTISDDYAGYVSSCGAHGNSGYLTFVNYSVDGQVSGYNNGYDYSGAFTATYTLGCTDSEANNYNASATIDNGSCNYDTYGCTDPEAINYNPDATVDDESCTYNVYGCMSEEAINYTPSATIDDGSCIINATTTAHIIANTTNVGLAIIITLISLFAIAYTFNTLYKKKKPWR